MRHLQFWFARTSISGEVLMKVGKEALNSRQEDCYRQPRHGLQQDFNQHKQPNLCASQGDSAYLTMDITLNSSRPNTCRDSFFTSGAMTQGQMNL